MPYRELYTSVPYESEEMLCIQHEIAILKNPMYQECSFNLCDVKRVSAVLNCIKATAARGLKTMHIINAGDDCCTSHIALLFSFAHGTVPVIS